MSQMKIAAAAALLGLASCKGKTDFSLTDPSLGRAEHSLSCPKDWRAKHISDSAGPSCADLSIRPIRHTELLHTRPLSADYSAAERLEMVKGMLAGIKGLLEATKIDPKLSDQEQADKFQKLIDQHKGDPRSEFSLGGLVRFNLADVMKAALNEEHPLTAKQANILLNYYQQTEAIEMMRKASATQTNSSRASAQAQSHPEPPSDSTTPTESKR